MNAVFILLRHEAERLEQEAKGRLERQKISDEAEAEKARKELLELQANSAAVESTGQAKAEAQSRAEASRIEGEAAVEQAKLKVGVPENMLCSHKCGGCWRGGGMVIKHMV